MPKVTRPDMPEGNRVDNFLTDGQRVKDAVGKAALTLMRRLRHVKQPVLVLLFTSFVLCLAGATIKLGSVEEGSGIRLETSWYGEGTCMP